MAFDLYDKVRIIDKGIVGTIVDIFDNEGKRYYTVESDTPVRVRRYDPDAYPGDYPLYDCTEDRLSKA